MRAGDFSGRETEAARAVRLALDRHQRRREQRIPTLGVLVGAPAEAVAAWRDWARAAGWNASVREMDGRPEDTPDPLTAGEFSREAVLQVRRSPGEGKKAEPGPGLVETVARMCRLLEARGGDLVGRPLALAVAPAEAAAFLRDEAYSRTRTLFAEGLVFLPSAGHLADGREASTGPETAGQAAAQDGRVPSAATGTVARPSGETAVRESVARVAPRLTARALRAETAASFDAAQAALRGVAAAPADAAEADRARSAAERFLFDLLDDLPETRGVFALNVRLGFCFGPMRAEVDLLAAELRLAVEIDGFHHFRDPDGYRRDRRKDALLQRQGYLVLRFLAEDVVVRLEEILEEILTTVAFRRATLP